MEESVGQVLLKVQDDLGRLREQLEAGGGGSSAGDRRFDGKALREALAKAESDLRMRSDDVLSRVQVAPVRLPQIAQARKQDQNHQHHNHHHGQQTQHHQQQHEPLPIVIPAKEAKRGGLLALMERGTIPPAANVTLEPQPIRHRQAPAHDPATRARDRFPADAADPGYTHEGYQMDDTTEQQQQKNKKQPSGKEQKKKQRPTLTMTTRKTQPAGTVQVRQFEPPLRVRSGGHLEREAASNEAEAMAAAAAARRQSAAAAAAAAAPPPTTPASFAAPANTTTTVAIRAVRFAVQNGQTRREASDFMIFRRRCELLDGVEWNFVERLICQLERLMQTFSIPMALVDGERLCDLAELSEPDAKTDDAELLSCLANRVDVMRLMQRPGRQFVGPGGTERACVVIQKRWRGYRALRDYRRHLVRKQAARVIGGHWRQYSRLLELRSGLKRTRQLQLENYRRRFEYMQDNWDRWASKRRVVIHIPSLGYPEKIRAGFTNFCRVQNTQMARLCDIRDPNVDVVLLSAVAMDDEMTQYYSRLLSGLDATSQQGAKSASERYKIIVPEAAKLFAERCLPLATLLKYSPRALRRIRNLIQGRPAFIVPGYPCEDDLAVADKLDVPILCPEPQVTQLYGTKSGGRRVFQAAGVPTPPGDFDVYSLTQLRDCLAQLVVSNLSVTRWLLKLDSQFDGRGIGYVDVDQLPCYRWAIRERRRYGDKWEKKWAQEKVYLKVHEELLDLLASPAAQVACPEAYPTWQLFQQEFLSQGGVLEAFPPAESVTRLTVDLCVEPNGSVRLLASGDQLTSRQKEFACLGVSSPQCSVQPDQLNTLCRRIGEACRERRIYGYASVDFVTFEPVDGVSDRQEIWATDLSLHYSDTTALSQLFYLSTGGRFDVDQHEVIVPVGSGSAGKAAGQGRTGVMNGKSTKRPHRKDNGRRYATLSSRLWHSNLAKLQYAAFFKVCKAHGIEFDTVERTGSIFCLIDPFNRDAVGMVTISKDLCNSLETFARNLTVIDQEVSGSAAEQVPSNFAGLVDELDDVISATKENAASATNGH